MEWHQPKVETAFQPNDVDVPLYFNICICVGDSARGFKLTMSLRTSVPVATDALHRCVPHMGNTRVHSHVLTVLAQCNLTTHLEHTFNHHAISYVTPSISSLVNMNRFPLLCHIIPGLLTSPVQHSISSQISMKFSIALHACCTCTINLHEPRYCGHHHEKCPL